MKAYLVSFEYEEDCQGYERAWTHGTLLVYADSFEEACRKIRINRNYPSAKDFKNLTIGLYE